MSLDGAPAGVYYVLVYPCGNVFNPNYTLTIDPGAAVRPGDVDDDGDVDLDDFVILKITFGRASQIGRDATNGTAGEAATVGSDITVSFGTTPPDGPQDGTPDRLVRTITKAARLSFTGAPLQGRSRSYPAACAQPST
ncbi:MAG: hypothetical protein GX591_16960 [Planctomycetes bacterium]|nr:hypothetical protein [Planctomycetota bacterium]